MAERNYIRKVVIFCGARDGVTPAYGQMAENLGRLLVENGFDEVIYGSGPCGLMGRVQKGVLEAGGKVVGITPAFFFAAQGRSTEIEELTTEDMFERKKLMLRRADAAIILPGGFGTIDEAGEVLCYNDVMKYADPDGVIMPSIFLNYNGFFEGMRLQLEVCEREGFISEAGRGLWHFVADEHAALEKLQELDAKGPQFAKDYGSFQPEGLPQVGPSASSQPSPPSLH